MNLNETLSYFQNDGTGFLGKEGHKVFFVKGVMYVCWTNGAVNDGPCFSITKAELPSFMERNNLKDILKITDEIFLREHAVHEEEFLFI